MDNCFANKCDIFRKKQKVYHMFNKLLPITIIASSMAFAVSAETKLSTSYLSNNVKTGSQKISADGYDISIQFEYESGLSTSVGYSSISGSGLTLSTITTMTFSQSRNLDTGGKRNDCRPSLQFCSCSQCNISIYTYLSRE